MKKKWMFQLALFDLEDHEFDSFPVFKTKFEIADLSAHYYAQPDPSGRRKGIDWSTINSPFQLQSQLDSIGDHKSFSFRKAWDGSSATNLRSLSDVYPQAILSVHKLRGSSRRGHNHFHLIPIVSFILSPAQFRFIRSEPFVGGERFGLRFSLLRKEFH